MSSQAAAVCVLSRHWMTTLHPWQRLCAHITNAFDNTQCAGQQQHAAGVAAHDGPSAVIMRQSASRKATQLLA